MITSSFLSLFTVLSHAAFFLMAAMWPFSGTGETAREIKKTHLELPADVTPYRTLRVLITQQESGIPVEIQAPFEVFNAEGYRLFSGERLAPTVIKTSGSKIMIGSQVFSRVPVTIESKTGEIKAGKRSYRGSLSFSPGASGKLTVINHIGLEDYLRGVLPWEANPKWTPESLKAQAVASRTYALFQAIDRRNEAFDLSSGVMSQVYAGQTVENQATDRAIAETRGQILMAGNEIISTFFHSTCGGATTKAESAWYAEPHAVLKGVPCDFCRASKHYRWENEIPKAEIIAALKKQGMPVTGLERFEGMDRDASGRFQAFRFSSGGQSFKIQSNDFRLWVGPEKLKSTKIDSMQDTGTGLLMSGYGWGHGVGLCQYGMKKLGELGYNYKQILDYYFPGSYIINIER